jgi:hypothetical protein
MAVTLSLINYDDIYATSKTEKILINYIDVFNKETKEKLDDLIVKNYTEDNLSLIPTCRCGELKGVYYIGQTCHKCNTTVVSAEDNMISFLLWAKAPQGVQKFINLIILQVLLNRYKLNKPKVSLVEYIINSSYKFDKKQNLKNYNQIEKLDYLLREHNIKRGYNSFIENFFPIVEILEEHFTDEKNTTNYNFIDFLKANANKLFSTYLPFPNKMLFTMESNELGKFIDKRLVNAINVIRRLTGIDLHTKSVVSKQNKIAKSLIELAAFYEEYIKNIVFSKNGLVRQHIVSTRSHFTMRCVISSIPGPHALDELHLPWSASCTLFREFILNRLYARGYTYKAASNFIMQHIHNYHPLLDEIFKEIIASSVDGIKCFFNRNPSLHRGSIQLMRITRIKTDPRDTTISVSVLSLPPMNGDADGDELNLTLLLTKKEMDYAKNFLIYHNTLSLSGPNEIAGNSIKYPKTVVSTLANWMDHY